MKQLGNLAIVCAKRPEILMELHGGLVSVHLGHGPSWTTLYIPWDDDQMIQQTIHELNFGKYADKELNAHLS